MVSGLDETTKTEKRFQAMMSRLLPVLALLAVWEVAGRLAHSRLFPATSTVGRAIIDETISGRLPFNLGLTLARVAAAFFVAMILGTALGVAMGRWRQVDLIFDSLLTALLNLPALVLIILLFVWFGLNETAALAAVALNKLPTTAVTLREGTRALDRNLDEMARSFAFGPAKTLRHVVLPQLYTYLFAAARSGLALIWKIVLVVELLGRSNGVGFEIQLFFQLLDVTHILAYTAALIAVIQLIEWGVFQPLERRLQRWRA